MIANLVNLKKGDTKMSKAEAIKMGIGTIISLGVDFALGTVLGSFLPVSMRGWKRALYCIGALGLSLKLGEDAENYFYKVYDETKQAVTEAKKELDETTPEEGADA